MNQASREHWESIYAKADDALSWTQPCPMLSLQLIRRFAHPKARVIDMGGGTSGLAAALAQEGFLPCVVDISQTALDRAKARLASELQNRIDWRVADILDQPDLPHCDLWHDRALFHFLVQPLQRKAYARLAEQTIVPGGAIILATFALTGPDICSGLSVQRYDAPSLAREFTPSFHAVWDESETHYTPSGVPQDFIYVVLERSAESLLRRRET